MVNTEDGESSSNLRSWIRITFWPIYGKENWKFIPMLAMMTLALFIYTTLRIHKDTYILSAPLSSANTTSFLKAYLVLPFSVIYMMIFCSLSNKLSKEKIFFIALCPFFLFFFVFFIFLLPNSQYLHMSIETISFWQNKYPNFKNLIPVIAYWSFSLYYVFSELWGTIVISFLFWGFANYASSAEQSKRFYAFFASYSYIGLMSAAKIQSYVYEYSSRYEKGSKEYFDILFVNFYFVIISMSLFLILFWFVNNKVLPFDKTVSIEAIKMTPKKKPSLKDSIFTVIGSKYLMYIAVIVICYGLTSNLIELTWKELVRREFNGEESLIGKYMSDFYFITGFCTIFLGLVNKYLTSKFGWLKSSLVTPIAIMIFSFFFFFLLVFGSYLPNWMLFGYSSGFLAMQIGFLQDIISKGCKYGILDPNIQMTYLPLDDDLKTKGKASVDIVGSRAGKSGGAFLESNLSVLFKGADQIALAPIFMPIVLCFCGVWIFFTIVLAEEYAKSIKK
ncbi:Npt1/Npt2 family nucleotide transporter [Alphaproteobacteria bacterium endosymbiont of Tiliacea citrago]|uniref:Npt1/Npt2 family nucleotide transporter n=1 Tax=Alphaproteobacteria bacterium endosymbiont of Tiliacea citrago TaxID=3077944 RepID=UPI00313DFDEF